jgi:hypothetical protein
LKHFGEEIQTLFLGNKPSGVTKRHYTATHNDYRLDKPLAWLREQYFGTVATPPLVVAPDVGYPTETPAENV